MSVIDLSPYEDCLDKCFSDLVPEAASRRWVFILWHPWELAGEKDDLHISMWWASFYRLPVPSKNIPSVRVVAHDIVPSRALVKAYVKTVNHEDPADVVSEAGLEAVRRSHSRG